MENINYEVEDKVSEETQAKKRLKAYFEKFKEKCETMPTPDKKGE